MTVQVETLVTKGEALGVEPDAQPVVALVVALKVYAPVQEPLVPAAEGVHSWAQVGPK